MKISKETWKDILKIVGTIIATIVNYIRDGVPAATIYANVESMLESEIDLRYGKK